MVMRHVSDVKRVSDHKNFIVDVGEDVNVYLGDPFDHFCQSLFFFSPTITEDQSSRLSSLWHLNNNPRVAIPKQSLIVQ